jgi:antitoxin component YwqK of YwqJK toxin-antitoxin module
MKPLLFLFAVISSLATLAQKVEKFYDYRWEETTTQLARFYSVIDKTDSGWHRRDYYIQERLLQMDGTFEDSACKKPNGQFRYYHSNGRLAQKCRYVHGKLQGLLLSYHYNGIINDSINFSKGHRIGTSYGWFENGYPSDSAVWNADGSGEEFGWFNNGIPSYAGKYGPREKKEDKWTYYHRNGKPSAVESYKEGVLIDKQYFDEEGNATDTVNKDRPAMFPRGPKAWQKYLKNQLYFPPQYKLVNGDKAIVVVEAIIDEEGNVGDVNVSVPFHPAFDKIAIEVVKNSRQWEPSIQHNRKVRYKIKQPVAFAQR